MASYQMLCKNSLQKGLASWASWWQRYPALLYGIALTLGIAFHIAPGWHLFPPLLALWLPLFPAFFCGERTFALRLLFALLFFFSGYLYIREATLFPEVPTLGSYGYAQIALHTVDSTPRGYELQGSLEGWQPVDGEPIATSLPLRFRLPLNGPAGSLSLERRWLVVGTLLPPQHGFSYRFRPNRQIAPEPLSYNWIGWWGDMRHALQKRVMDYIEEHFASPRSARLLMGMLTGRFDDKVMRNHLGRFGLQHLLAISGFHFSLMAACFALPLLCLPWRQASLVLLLGMLFFYFLFLDPAPSIVRAWISLSLATLAPLLKKGGNSLNILGFALIVVGLWQPTSICQVGYQCSFGITAAILLGMPFLDRWLQPLMRTRSLSTVVEWERSHQHVYLMGCMIRQAIALGIAVNLAALPILLYHFAYFPVLSLIYNLFFPLFVGWSVMLFLLGVVLHIACAPLGLLLHSGNDRYLHGVIGLVMDAPPYLDWNWETAAITPLLLTTYLTVLYTLAIWGSMREQRDAAAPNWMI